MTYDFGQKDAEGWQDVVDTDSGMVIGTVRREPSAFRTQWHARVEGVTRQPAWTLVRVGHTRDSAVRDVLLPAIRRAKASK